MNPNWREQNNRDSKVIIMICGVVLIILLIAGYFLF